MSLGRLVWLKDLNCHRERCDGAETLSLYPILMIAMFFETSVVKFVPSIFTAVWLQIQDVQEATVLEGHPEHNRRWHLFILQVDGPDQALHVFSI